jgi:hypothetical protein
VWLLYAAAGNAVWGSSPSINTELGHVYIATGNNYGEARMAWSGLIARA